jgi:hypothetical protein
MKRSSMWIVASLVVAALVPAVALARTETVHHHRGQHHQKVRHHRARIRHERFGSVTATSASAGKVRSFTAGALTLSLADGSTASGKVTDATRLECMSAGSTIQSDDRHGGSGLGDNSSRGDDNSGSGDDNDQGEDRGDDNGEHACAAGELKPGATVHEAELKISSAGAIWEKVELAG